MFQEILKAFVTLFIIIDPFVSATFFVNYSKNADKKEREKTIWTAIGVAAVLLLLFLFSGLYLLKIMRISFEGLKIAGGIILLIMGVTSVLGIEYARRKEGMKSAAILIGTPLLSGPGALTTIIILSKDYGYFVPGIAALLVLIASYFILKSAHFIQRIFGKEIMEIMSRVMGLLLAALAVDYIWEGILSFIQTVK